MEKTAVPEPELIARIVAGEKELFHDLIRPHERRVYLTVLAVLRSEADAEDAAQEAILKAYRNLGSFRAEAKFSTWLTSIALNEARGRLRKAGRHVVESLDEQLEEHEGDYTPALLTDWREIPSAALERKELRAALQSAVAELPPIYKEVFTLRDLQELDVQETARILGLSANLVKVRLHRARMMLQKRLTPVLKNALPPRKGLFGRKAWS